MMAMDKVTKRVIQNDRSISINAHIIVTLLVLIISIVHAVPQRGNKDSCQVDADCQKGGQRNRCCSQFYFCGTGPDYCAEGIAETINDTNSCIYGYTVILKTMHIN